ncbi:hypothetical protein [Amycolatopsis sp. NPDC049159]|uniref:hypothetical protein n=1 Tax=Amycolatopsis sp. NPDC049159 TaxID=3157210 RepID=UPI0034032118
MRRNLTVLAVLLAGLVGLAPPAAVAGTPSDVVTLITGDRVAVRSAPDGRSLYDVRPAAAKGMARALVHLRLGDRDYEVPGTALPYLGRGLDLSLFDLQALRAGAALPADPSTFGAALARQFKEDNARGHFGGTGLFAAGKSFALAGTRPAAQPRSVMRTVSVDANDIGGKPADTGVAFLYNTDDGNLLDPNENLNYFSGGTAKFSAPDGNYSALGLFWTADADGNPTEVRFSAQPEFAVKADTTVRVDAARASSKLTWVTPRPALLDDTGFLFRRAAKTGPALVVDFDAGPGVPIAVSPTAVPVRTGALQTYPYSRLVSPPGPGTPYEYVLQKAAVGRIPPQRYVITAQDVAAVDSTYFSEFSSLGLRQRSGMFSFEDSGGRVSHPIPLPRRQTEYVSAAPDLRWFGGFSKYVLPGPFAGWAGGQYESFHAYRGGTSVTEDWNRFPLHPAGGVALLPLDDGTAPVRPAATRAGDLLRLSITPFSDNQPGHTGFGLYGEVRDTVTGHYTLTQDGATIAEGSPVGATEVSAEQAVAAGPSTLGLTIDAGRTGPMYRQSTASHTEWTWRSRHVEGATLPAALYCARGGSGPDRACGVEPLLTLGYAVGGLRPDGSALVGPQSLDLTVGHLQRSTASPVAGATVQYSTDGVTWQDATVTARGDGLFHADFTAATDSFRGADVSLRVTASDTAGARIAETITAAYRVYQS